MQVKPYDFETSTCKLITNSSLLAIAIKQVPKHRNKLYWHGDDYWLSSTTQFYISQTLINELEKFLMVSSNINLNMKDLTIGGRIWFSGSFKKNKDFIDDLGINYTSTIKSLINFIENIEI